MLLIPIILCAFKTFLRFLKVLKHEMILAFKTNDFLFFYNKINWRCQFKFVNKNYFLNFLLKDKVRAEGENEWPKENFILWNDFNSHSFPPELETWDTPNCSWT